MTPPPNPALQAFLAALGGEKVWGQVLIQAGPPYTLRHFSDREAADLRRISQTDVRALATFTKDGQFRPLRAAPDLANGWLLVCNTADELWRALQEFYPGSIADWFAAGNGNVPVTNYREFTDRQTGMYRASQMLSDAGAANVIRAGCHAQFCLKRRYWSVDGLAPDSFGKSEIPCLEPCAILLELARKGARLEQEEKLPVQLSRSDLDSVLAAANAALGRSAGSDRTGNVGAAGNPRRLQLLIEKLTPFAAEKRNGDE